jgi:hypothetical protein
MRGMTAADPRFPRKGLLVPVACLAICLFGAQVVAGGETQEPGAAARGKEIYLNGIDYSGAQIKCVTGEQGTEISDAVLKCGSCHEKDGRGKAEGGVFPSNIRWSELTNPTALRRSPAGSARLIQNGSSFAP